MVLPSHIHNGPVAQPGRAPRLHRGGFGFEFTGLSIGPGTKVPTGPLQFFFEVEQGPFVLTNGAQ